MAETYSFVLEHFETNYACHLQVFTDGFVEEVSKASAQAFHIPSLNISWSVCLTQVMPLTTAVSVPPYTPEFPSEGLSLRSLRSVHDRHSRCCSTITMGALARKGLWQQDGGQPRP